MPENRKNSRAERKQRNIKISAFLFLSDLLFLGVLVKNFKKLPYGGLPLSFLGARTYCTKDGSWAYIFFSSHCINLRLSVQLPIIDFSGVFIWEF